MNCELVVEGEPKKMTPLLLSKRIENFIVLILEEKMLSEAMGKTYDKLEEEFNRKFVRNNANGVGSTQRRKKWPVPRDRNCGGHTETHRPYKRY